MKSSLRGPQHAIATTYTGLHLDLLWPELAEIRIDDIAASLADTTRFNGHGNRSYTVAEHCLLGAEQCTPGCQLEFLLHDASEAYLGDIVGPLKRTEMFAAYRALEAQWGEAIAERFGVRAKTSKEVHTVDQRMLLTEQRDLMGRRPRSTDAVKPFPMLIAAVSPSREALADRFLAKFYELAARTEGAKR